VTGVNNDVFDLKALQDIHIGIHGTKGHSGAVWTFSWSKEALDKSLALQKVSADLRPILGVAVQTHGTTSGNVYVCWALAQKQINSNQSQYSIHDLLGSDHVTFEGNHEVILHTAESLRYVGSHGKWYPAFSEGRRPKTDPHNGNIFFPHIKVNSSDKTFKLRYNFGVNPAARPMILQPPPFSNYKPLARSSVTSEKTSGWINVLQTLVVSCGF